MSGSISNAFKMRTPAYTHAPVSYIDCVKFEFSFLEEFLLLAQAKGALENPVERLKYITAAQLATIHYGIYTMGLRRPLNPIIGETGMIETTRGSKLYLEQTSHHPPITNFLMEGPPDLPFYISGYLEFKISIKGVFSSCIFSAPGKMVLSLPDGSVLNL